MLRDSSDYRDLMIVPLAALAGASLLCLSAFGQDGQSAATAKVARDRAAAAAVENTTPGPKAAVDKEASPAAQAESLKRRGGEKTSDGNQGRSIVLGMSLQETNNGQVKVVDVAAASPAFDAGIRKGDELISFGDFKADTYRKWIDGMRRVATESLDGSMLPVAVMRNHQVVSTKVRMPEGRASAVRLPVGPGQAGPGALAAAPQPAEQNTTGATPDGGKSVAIESSGPFGAFFNDRTSPASDRAMAQLVRVSGVPKTAAIAAPASATAESVDTNSKDTNARIGLAGFRNDQSRMLVMVDVGGLEPGNYVVGLSEPTAITAPAPSGTPSSPNAGLPTPKATDVAPANRQISSSVDTNAVVAPLLTEIGTLTVDQSGTGRLQHAVEGVQVRSVVGQAIVIYAQTQGSAQNTLPPNLDPSADPGAAAATKRATATADTRKLAPTEPAPVASGIIRLISAHQPTTTSSSAPEEDALFNSPAPVQPARNASVPPQTTR